MSCTHAGSRRARLASSSAATGPSAPEILSSWARSEAAISPDVTHAPLADEGETAEIWRGSPLQTAVQRVEAELRRTAEDGDLVVAVTDADTRILWTYGGRVMRRKAETVNFVPGGRWDDQSVGTNALDLANRPRRRPWCSVPSTTRRSCTTGSAGRRRSTTPSPAAAGRHRPLDDLGPHPPDRPGHRAGDGAADRDGDAAPSRRPTFGGSDDQDEPGLSLTLLGTVETRLDGQRLLLNRRQTEVLALLAMHPEGLSPEHLHALVYGDQAVTLSTLKAEVSHLRSALGGQLSSRPYRLMMPVTTDVDTC